MSALTLPCGATDVVRRLIAGEPVDAAASGLSAREWRELAAVLGLQSPSKPETITAAETSS